MTDTPVRDYYEHKYPTDEAAERTTVSLRHVNDLLRRVKELERTAGDMRAELDCIGEYLCDSNPCKRRYKGVKGLDADA
jgi:hypothetical protein